MNYNSLILEEIPKVVSRILGFVDTFSNEYKIIDHKVSIDDSDLADPGSYVSTYSTCAFRVDVQYTLNNDDIRDFSFEIPRMINGLFIIKGKYKLINRYLTDDNVCIKMGDYFRFKFGFSYNFVSKVFNYFDYVNDDDYNLTYEEVEQQFPELLEFNEYQSWKMKILLDLDYLPSKLTQELADKLIDIKIDANDAINKRILSIDSILVSALHRSALDIAKLLQSNFYKYGTISGVPFQTFIDKIFYNQGSETNTINTSSNVNPYSFDSMNQKVVLEHTKIEGVKPQEFSESLMDLIDPIVTPDNVNVNRINYLNSSTKVVDKSIQIKVLDKKFNEIYLDYYKYVGSKVVPYRFVDYENKKVSKDFMVLENRKEKKSKTYEYIQCPPDDRLSVLTRSIPMLNLTDSVRIAMAARMISQAVPLVNPDVPRVQSGHEGDTRDSTTDIKFESSLPGKVLSVNKDKVVVEVDGIPKEYKVPGPNIGIYDVTTVYEPSVSPGQSVKTGDVLITQRISTSGTRNLGLNTLTAFMPFRGYNYEDGIIISESYAKRLTHYSIVDVTAYVRDTESIVSVLPIGSKIKSRDILVKVISSFKSQSNEKLVRLMVSAEDLVKNNNLMVPNNIQEGYITDIKFHYDEYKHEYGKASRVRNELEEGSKLVLEESMKQRIKLPEFIPDSYITEIPEVPEYEGYAAAVTIRLLCINPASVGTKISNFYGSKGVITKIIPDEEMIRTVDGKVVECILNSDAVFARKNVSQVPVMQLALIADKILDKGRELGVGEFKKLVKNYHLDTYAKMSDAELENLLNDPNTKLNYVTGCYSKFNMSQIQGWMEELDVKDKVQVIDGKTKRPIRNPIMVSNMYMIKLYHLPEHYNKVYTDESSAPPVLGMGEIRNGGGQMQGEMEYHALAASDLDEYIYKVRNKYQFRDAQAISINLALAGVNVKFKPKEDLEE